MKLFGLIGNPLGHSFSPQIHAELGDYAYKLFPMKENEVEIFLKERTFDGINVTIPYKETVIPYLDRISKEAKEIGSVNTIIKERDGTLSGHNTDYFGFSAMLARGKIEVKGKKALILGSGGSSKTVKSVLFDLGAREIVVISRKGEYNYDNISKHSDAEIIVNTTPVGMYPHNGAAAVDLSLFPKCEGVADLIYNPARTVLMLQAEVLKIKNVGGLAMLAGQAIKGSELFLGITYPEGTLERVVGAVSSKMQNIILVGMPGSGKSSVGRALADALGRPFWDSDTEITKVTGKMPSEIITSSGEAEFRKIESDVLSDICKKSGCVIATGGGVVTVLKNHDFMRQNGKVVFINRDINILATANRPLSGDISKREALYQVRLPFYRMVSDFEVTSDDSHSVEDIRDEILRRL